MQDFYRKALVAFSLLLIADALMACLCFYLSYPSAPLMPGEGAAAGWHAAPNADATIGGASTVRIQHAARQSLSFDFKLSTAIPHPWAWAALTFDDANGKAAAADWSKYATVTFLVRCKPANSLILNITMADAPVAKPGAQRSELPAMTYFSCNEKATPVSLDLTRLGIAWWWYEAGRVDIARHSYPLDQVVKLEFGASQYSPRGQESHVEISDLTLHGRDERYLVALAVLLVAGWSAFGIWFFLAQSRALVATLESRLKTDLSFVAYRQLTVEPFEDQEKAAILRFIATHYANAGLDLDAVATGTGASRNKITEVLKTELGMTFNSYVKKLRLTEAARLLTHEAAASVAEIAHSVGYAHGSHFNKLFKEEYGCTPREFKNLAPRPAPPSVRSPAIP